MRNFYLLITLFFCAPFLHAQTPELAPLENNPTLRIINQQQQLEWAYQVEKLTGFNPLTSEMPETLDDCDDDYGFDLVEEGGEIFLSIDTIGLGGGIFGDSLVLDMDCGLVFSESILLAGSSVQYNAALFDDNADLKQDTVCVDFYQEGGEIIPLKISVSIRRKGQSVVMPVEMIGINSTAEFCIDESMVALPTPLQCGQIDDILDDGYDGNGIAPQNAFRVSAYCFSYSSNAFPGTDLISFTLCDELGICDVFTFPIEVPTTVLDAGGANLIFVDDFSYDGPYPNPEMWLDDQVYINNSLGFEPISVGVATFDGLDRSGTPYDIDFAGIGDRLTSQPINMSYYDDDSEVYFKFYVQRKGYGLAPSFLDSMLVEFKDDNGNWKKATDGYPGYLGTISSDSIEAFQYKVIKIEDDDFFHDRFQFRFSSIVSPAGVGDLWHLDFVTLQANNFEESFFRDIAFTKKPTNFLKTYWQMPWNQFEGFEALELQDSVVGELFNHWSDVENADNNSITFLETETNTPVGISPKFDLEDNLAPDSRKNVKEEISDFNALVSDLQVINAEFEEKRVVEVKYNFIITTNNLIPGNDEVKTSIVFDNCLAYDDGTAETQAFFPDAQGGEQFAQKYHLNVADTITGVKFLFPHLTENITTQQFKWEVYDEMPAPDVDPVYESAVLNPFYVDAVRDTLQGFTTYRAEDEDGEPMGIELPAGDFWITFIQLSAATRGIPLGFDLHDSVAVKTNLFAGSDDNFFNFFSFRGILMINPILGGTPFNSPTSEVQKLTNVMTIYPNPASDKVFVNLLEGNYDDFEVQIFNNLGQLVKVIQLDSEINVDNLGTGLYFLKVNNVRTLETFQQKLLIAK
ncbi:MAG: hypothetical protein ACI9XO_001027 [Paraglaciecola sp.]|jgi:hypothetical protein